MQKPHMFLALTTTVLFAISALGQNSLPTLHVPHVVSNGEAPQVGIAPVAKLMHLDIMLPLRNQGQLTDLVKRLYDRSNPDYRHFLTPAQFTNEFGPTVNDYQAVVSWAKSKGFVVGEQPENRLIVPITGSVAQVNAAFHVTIRAYQHPTENRIFYAPDSEPSVDVGVPLWHIAGMSNYSVPRPALSKGGPANASGSGPGGAYLPEDMRAVYYGGTSLTGSGQCVGLAEFNGYDISDVTGNFDGAASATTNGNNYALTYHPSSGGSYSISINDVLLDGGTLSPDQSDTNAEAEVALDIAQAIGMAPGISQLRVYIVPDAWSNSGNYVFPANSGDTEILSQMVDDYENGVGCAQLSMSWNWAPDSTDVDNNSAYFSEMQTIGQSFLVASGDSGSWPSGAYYYPEEETNVTAVGGTDLTTSGAGGYWISEEGWSDSGGGVSPDDVAIPSYQQLAGFGCTGCSSSYRNAPDVSMEANFDNYSCAFGSCSGNWGGTSFAAPRWAGFVALANQQAASDSLGPIGFLNPSIYEIGLSTDYSNSFHDITSGSNGAYSAETGYDLVTGWGSPQPNLIDELAGGFATGWVTFNGPEGPYADCLEITESTITVGSFQASEPDGNQNLSGSELAIDLASQLNASSSPVTARPSGSTVFLRAKDPGTGGNSISLSASGSECVNGPRKTYPIFTANTSGSALSGAQ